MVNVCFDLIEKKVFDIKVNLKCLDTLLYSYALIKLADYQ